MKIYPPGSTIGLLGGGQLGRMSILAGRRLGYRFVVLDPQPDGPAAMVADAEINAPFGDLAAARKLASMVDVVTLEFENIPSDTVAEIEKVCPVRPGWKSLHTCQNRLREKMFLEENGFPCVPFEVVRTREELEPAVMRIGLPCVVKTADFGYDGKGQIRVDGLDQLADVADAFAGKVAVVEKWIDFSGEFSVICARNPAGASETFPIAENEHRNHILFRSSVPSGLSFELESEARVLALEIAQSLDLVGLLAVELFLTEKGWLVNELAPRPHNSGHYTFDACLTNQFEQHIRAIAGLPLGDCRQLTPVTMINLLGDLWRNGEMPDWGVILAHPQTKLHLYGKKQARPGRKMGHFSVLAPDLNESVVEALELFECLERG